VSLGLYWVLQVYPKARSSSKSLSSYIDSHTSNRGIHPASNSNELEKKSELTEQKKESGLEEEVVTEGDIEMAEQYNKIAKEFDIFVFHDQNLSDSKLPNDVPAPDKNNVTNNHEAQVVDNLYKQAEPAVSLHEETAETVQEKSSGNIVNKNTLSGKSKENRKNASRTYYTIQTGSYIEVMNARNEFKSINQSLVDKMLDNLRIEKVGEYYTVRLGKFEDYATTNQFHQTIKPQFPESIIVKADINDDRIVKLYE
jgi:hypothetical protein